MTWAVIDVYWRAVIVYSSSRAVGCGGVWQLRESQTGALQYSTLCAQTCVYSCVTTFRAPHVLRNSLGIVSVLMWVQYFHSFGTFLQSMSMRSRWSYIAWICVFSLGAFRTFCIPGNEGKTRDLGTCCLQGLLVVSFRLYSSGNKGSDQEQLLAPCGSWVAIWLFGDWHESS